MRLVFPDTEHWRADLRREVYKVNKVWVLGCRYATKVDPVYKVSSAGAFLPYFKQVLMQRHYSRHILSPLAKINRLQLLHR